MAEIPYDFLDVHIDTQTEVPVWHQIAAQLALQVNKKRLKIGEFTWSVRLLAQNNKVSRTGIQRAYETLKQKGALEGQAKIGYKLGENITKLAEKIFELHLNNLILIAKQQGLEKQIILKELNERW